MYLQPIPQNLEAISLTRDEYASAAKRLVTKHLAEPMGTGWGLTTTPLSLPREAS